MACVIDWALVLEFTKTLAGPMVTLGSVWLVARFGLKGYRTQKAFERRLDWYERTFRQIAITSEHYARAEATARFGDASEAGIHFAAGRTASETLLSYCEEALLYAPVSGYEATAHLTARMLQVNVTSMRSGGMKTADQARDISIALAKAATALSTDVRMDMGLPPLPVVRIPDPNQ